MPPVLAPNRAQWTQKGGIHPFDEALGRSRGGLSTKVHLACDGKGRPRKRPARLIADKGYAFPSRRKLLSGRGIAHTIPERRDQRQRRGRRRGGSFRCVLPRLDRGLDRKYSILSMP